MKKIFLLFLFVIGLVLLPVVALAEGGQLPVDPFSWAQLATIAGATTATLLVVQLLKLPLDRIWKIPTRIVAYFIALIIMLVATAFTEGLTPSNALLAVVNAVIVALAAFGAYEMTFRAADDKKKAEAVEE